MIPSHRQTIYDQAVENLANTRDLLRVLAEDLGAELETKEVGDFDRAWMDDNYEAVESLLRQVPHPRRHLSFRFSDEIASKW